METFWVVDIRPYVRQGAVNPVYRFTGVSGLKKG